MTRRHWILWAALLALLAAALWTARNYYQFGGFNDDAAYVVGAKRILRDGTLLADKGRDGGSAAYFPGYSILLIPVLVAGKGAYPPLQAYSLLWTLLGATCTMLLARRRFPTPAAMLLGALYVLSPAGLTCGTTVMSDVPFAAVFMLALWWGEGALMSGRQHWHWIGLLVSLDLVIRLPGVALVAAFGLALLVRRAWASLGLFTLGCSAGGLYTVFSLMLNSGAGNYTAQASANYAHNTMWRQQLLFWTQLPDYLARNYLGWPGSWLAIAILVLAAITVVKGRTQPVGVAFVSFVAFQSVWFFNEPRYWIFGWPLALLLACERVPRKVLPYLLGLLILAAVPRELAMLEHGPPNQLAWDERRAAYAWIRDNTSEGEVLAGVMNCTLECYTDRRTRPPGRSDFWSQFLAQAVYQGVDYLVVEPDDTIITVQGTRLTSTPRHLRHWADQSQLMDRVYDSRLVQVYRLRPEAWRLELAYRLWASGFSSPDPARKERLYLRALQLCPDFGDAEKELAKLYLSSPERAPEGIALLRRLVERTPIDLNAAYELALALQRQGDAAGARAVAEKARIIAESLGEPTGPLNRFLTP